MTTLLVAAATALLLNVAVGLLRLVRGPTAADRITASALVGAVGVAALLVMADAARAPALVVVALVLVVLALGAVMVIVVRSPAGRPP